MFKPSFIRNQRSKGFKVKHAVQICLLLAVVFWLLYDSKRSHSENENADEEETSSTSSHEGTPGILKLGRKHLQTKIAGGVGAEGHGEREKPGKDDERVAVDFGGGDDEIDGRYQYKADKDEVGEEEDDSIGEQDEFGMGKESDYAEAEGLGWTADRVPRVTHYTRDVASSAVLGAEENQSSKVREVRSLGSRSTGVPILETGKTAEQKQLRPSTDRGSTTTSDLNSLENTGTVDRNGSAFESEDADENGEEEQDWSDDDLRTSFEYSESSAAL